MNRYEKLQWLKEWYKDHRGEWNTQSSMVSSIRADRTAKAYLYDLYFSLTNKALKGCGSCESDALLFLMTKSTEEKMKKIMNCRFKLKEGVLLSDIKHKLPDATIANLTDEIAIAYLKDNPRRAQFFEVIPEDWDKEEEPVVEAKEEPIEEAETSENVSHETPAPEPIEEAKKEPKKTSTKKASSKKTTTKKK